MPPRVTVIIPAYNEEHRLGPVLDAYLAASAPEVSFLVVPNACTDGTVALVADYTRRFPGRVRSHVIADAVGKGGAVLAGFHEAESEIVGYLDADGATAPAEFQKLIGALGDADVAVASRWRPGAHADRKLVRRLASIAFIVVRQAIVPLPIWDTQCGAKVFRRAVLARVLPRLRVTNMAFDVELLAALADAGARMREVPTRWIEKGGSAKLSSFSQLLRTGMTMLRTLVAIRRARTKLV